MIDSFSGRYIFLSNFYYTKIRFGNMTWETSEHLFQAYKTQIQKEKIWIQQAETPGESKRRGRKVTLRPDWEHIKIDVMRTVIREKFTQRDILLKALLSTGDEYLLEGNTWHDNYWGNCTCKKCANIIGQNMLGRLLMELRGLYQNG